MYYCFGTSVHPVPDESGRNQFKSNHENDWGGRHKQENFNLKYNKQFIHHFISKKPVPLIESVFQFNPYCPFTVIIFT